MVAYCTRANVFAELDPRGFVARPRPIEDTSTDVDITTGTILLVASAFETDDRIRFSTVLGGSLPPELAALGLQYVNPIPLGFDTFKVANPSTGLPIAPFTSAGTGWAVTIDPLIRLDRLIAQVSGEIGQDLTGDKPPLLPDPVTGLYHPTVVGLTAREVGRRAVNSLMFDNAAYRVATDRLFATADRDAELRETLRKGWPLNPRALDQDTIPNDAARAYGGTPVPWLSGSL